MRRQWLVLLACLAWHLAPAAASPPTFVPTSCDLPGLPADLAPRLRCGTVSVPAEPGAGSGPMFRLAVVILAPASGATQPDPVLYIAGGPGSPLTGRTALLAQHEAGVLAPDRDLILVDQRGIGRSEPALCPGLARQQFSIFAAGQAEPALVEAWRHSYDLCRDEMAQAGQDQAWFGTTITAADLDAVRQALGIERWNIYALSYGTSVAMTMQALYPDRLRAVVLDSVLPVVIPLPAAETFGRALQRLFADCKADPSCEAAYPDLAATYRQAVLGLGAAALAVPLPFGLGRNTFDLGAETFRLIVNRSLYSRPGMAALPAFITAARDRRVGVVQPVIAAVGRNYAAMSVGAMAAVGCRDRPGFDGDAGPPVDSVVPGMCRGWTALGPPPLLAHDAAMPTLLLTGQLDPITPPEFARAAAAALGTRATVVEFANVGHGAQQASACGEAIVSAFLRHPASGIDADCATKIPPIAFAPGTLTAPQTVNITE